MLFAQKPQETVLKTCMFTSLILQKLNSRVCKSLFHRSNWPWSSESLALQREQAWSWTETKEAKEDTKVKLKREKAWKRSEGSRELKAATRSQEPEIKSSLSGRRRRTEERRRCEVRGERSQLQTDTKINTGRPALQRCGGVSCRPRGFTEEPWKETRIQNPEIKKQRGRSAAESGINLAEPLRWETEPRRKTGNKQNKTEALRMFGYGLKHSSSFTRLHWNTKREMLNIDFVG